MAKGCDYTAFTQGLERVVERSLEGVYRDGMERAKRSHDTGAPGCVPFIPWMDVGCSVYHAVAYNPVMIVE